MTLDLLKLVPQSPVKPDAVESNKSAASGGAGLADVFSNLLKEKMGDLVQVTGESNRLDREFAAGLTDNIHEVMIASQKAQLAVETAVQVRNLALRMYQSLTSIR